MGLRNRWNYSGYPYFITTTVVEWAYVFKRKPYFDILCESLVFCKNKYASKLLAYCLMPNHIHLVLWPDQNTAVSDFMRDFKKFTSVQIRKKLEEDNEVGLLQVLRRNAGGVVRKCGRRKLLPPQEHKNIFLPQEILPPQELLTAQKPLMERECGRGEKGQVFKLWKDRFDDLVLTKRKTIITKIHYIHANPVRKGLVSSPEDWLYSSAREYMSIGSSAISVETEW